MEDYSRQVTGLYIFFSLEVHPADVLHFYIYKWLILLNILLVKENKNIFKQKLENLVSREQYGLEWSKAI